MNIATMGYSDAFCVRQTQAIAGCTPAPIRAIKTIKNMWYIPFLNTHAVIHYKKMNVVSILTGNECDATFIFL